MRCPSLRLLVLVLACAGAAACGAAGTSVTPEPREPTGVPVQPSPHEVVAGVTAMVTEPVGPPSGVVVALVPGGGWTSADPSGLAPLAADLAAGGAVVVSLTYRTSTDGVYFPEPVQDVGCGVAFAASLAPESPDEHTTVAVVGHSAGAQLAAVVALTPQTAVSDDCPHPAASPDLLVGLAGPYDVRAAADQARLLFGPDDPDPADWDAGNPVALAGNRPDLPVLLVHGTADDVVPLFFSEQFADALRRAGHPVDVAVLDGLDHHTVYRDEMVGPVITDWFDRVLDR